MSPVSSNAGAIGRFAPSPPSAGGLFSAAQQHAAAQTQQQQILLQQQQQLLAQQHQNAMKAGMGLAMGGGGASGGGQLGSSLNPGGMNPSSGGFGGMLGRPPAVPTPGALQRPGSSLAGSGPGMQQVPRSCLFLYFLVPVYSCSQLMHVGCVAGHEGHTSREAPIGSALGNAMQCTA